ncbi:MAG: ATPase [Lachnospiraceae bacterium]|nr:ATPase [Lachnospiraceae bacterium]
MKEITLEELSKWNKESYELIDIRDDGLTAYGMMPDALHIDSEEIIGKNCSKINEINPDKKLVFYCQVGRKTHGLEEEESLRNRDCYSLEGGYISYLRSLSENVTLREERQHKAEESIRKKFHKQLFTPFAKACKTYQLINEGDNIAVCISGGKDSMLMAKLFQEIQRHRKVNFSLTFLVMDPGYNKENRALIESNAKTLGIPVTIFESSIFDSVDNIEKSPCYICARMRRGYLYSKAKELGCNKIALGHHYDDVIETILMGMLHGAQIQTMMPKLHSTNFEGMELIRPLYLIRESDIIAWRDYNELHFLQCACHFTDTCTTCHEDGTTSSKRLETKKLIAELKKDNPYVESNIFKSVENVILDTVIEYKKDGVRHNFLDEY